MLLPILLVPALFLAAAPKPAWIWTLPEVPGKVYGLGVATADNTRALALKQASDGAKADVVARLRANVKSDTKVSTDFRETRTVAGKSDVATATRSTTAVSDVNIQAQAVDLPGLSIETTYLDTEGASPTIYALAVLDLGIAEQELRSGHNAVLGGLAADPGDDGRAKLRRLQALKKGLVELGRLEPLAGLVRAGGGDPKIAEAIIHTRLLAEQELAALRPSLTFGLTPNAQVPVDAEVKAAVRTAILKEGLGWSDKAPVFAITMRARSGKNGVDLPNRQGGWWDYNRGADFVVAQGTLSLTLVDNTGQEYESTLIVAKGVGINEFQADTQLLQDYKHKLTKAVSAWMADLGK